MTKVLVVDDEEYIREVLQLNLEAKAYTVITAEHGKAAVAAVKKHEPDIILADIIMPEMDGIALCRKLKSHPEWQKIYFIMLTAKIKLEDKVKGLETGADDYITKPFKIKEILARLKVGERLNDYRKRNEELIINLQQQNQEIKDKNRELRSMQERIVNLEKLSTIGQMTSSITHELKNPITAIKSDLWLIRNRLTEASLQELILKTEDKINNTIGIIDNILSFCKIKQPETKCIKLLPVISAAIIANTYPEGVEIETDADKALEVMADAVQLKLVLVNLIKNAKEAYQQNERRGRIYISSRRRHAHAVLTIRDAAGGIPEVDRDKIFNFFYTTKKSGVGIGLAFVKHIIEAHGGAITCESSGVQTEFVIKLPVCPAE